MSARDTIADQRWRILLQISSDICVREEEMCWVRHIVVLCA